MISLLFVDDESNVLDGLRRSTRAFKEWRPAFAHGGSEALSLLAQSPFDVIVTDMRMPGMDGLGLLEKVTSLYPHMFRFILSGQSDDTTLAKAAGISHQYLSKPCNLEMLKSAINRAMRLRDRFASPALIELLSKFDTIPSAPTLYTELTTLLADNHCTMAKITALISRDMGMCARILQMANSSLLGTRRSVSSLPEAVNFLGFSMLQNLALAVHVFRKFEPQGAGSIDADSLWQHSFRTSRYAGAIAQSLAPADREIVEQAQVAGLLHDVGQLLMASSIPAAFGQVLQQSREQRLDLCAAEQAVLGATHGEIGGYILALWGLPEPVVEAIQQHHALPSNPHFVTLAVQAADAIDYLQNRASGSVDHPQMSSEWLQSNGFGAAWPEWVELCKTLTN